MDNQMDKQSTLASVLSIFDTAERQAREINELKRENRQLRDSLFSDAKVKGETPYAYLDVKALEEGRKTIYEGSIYTWRECRASRSGEDIEVTTFDVWIKEKMRKVPDFMSRDDFIAYFDDLLRADYEREKAEAIAALEESEQEQE